MLGDSDLAGELSLDTGGEHLVLHGDLRSQILVIDELTGYQPEKKPGRVEPEKVQVPAPVQAKVQERPQAFEATLRFRSDKVIAAKVPLEHFVDRPALAPGPPGTHADLSAGRRHGAGPGAGRHAGQSPAQHDTHRGAPAQPPTVPELARAAA